MTAEQFRAILAAHGGVSGTEIIDKSTPEKIEGRETGEMVPPATIRVRYTTRDGEITARQHDDGSFEILDDPKGLVKSADPQTADPTKAPTTKTFPDGTERQWDPAKQDWVIIATKTQGPEPEKPKPEAGLPGLGSAPGARPGQTTDLSLVYAQGNQYLAQLNNDVAAGRLPPEERARRWAAYNAANIQPARAQADAEVRAEAEKQARRQAQADARAERSSDLAEGREGRAISTAERTARTDEERLGLEREKFARDRANDAVKRTTDLLPYMVDPSFGPSLAGVYNRVLPGAFQPGAFSFDAPDLDAIAAQHVDPLLQMHSASVAPRAAVVPGQPPAAAPATDPLAGVPYVPQARPSMPGTSVPGPVAPGTRDDWWR